MAPRGERQPDMPRALTRAQHSYGDLNQEDNATEGGKPGIDDRRIGEERPVLRPAHRMGINAMTSAARRTTQHVVTGFSDSINGLVRPVVFAITGTSVHGLSPAFQDVGALFGYESLLQAGACERWS